MINISLRLCAYLLIVLAGLASCKHISPVVQSGLTTTVDCAEDAVEQVALDNLTDIELDILRDNWQDELKQDALKIGIGTVACIIKHITGESKRDMAGGAGGDPNAKVKVSRGEEWLKANQITFVQEPAPAN